MSLTLIPWLVLAVAAVVALRLPAGRDLAVAVFLMPWTALEVDVGVGVLVSQLVLMLLALKYFVQLRLDPFGMPRAGLIWSIAGIGMLAAVVTFLTHDVDIVFEGGSMRNGPVRAIVVLGVFIVAVTPFMLVHGRGVRVPVMHLLRVYVVSLVILGLLGLLQYVVFQATGEDIFPIGLLGGDEANLRSGVFETASGWHMRPNSFGGEPKGLAMSTVVALLLVMAFGRRLFDRRWQRRGAVALFVIITVLTQSTSAYVSFGVGVAVFLLLRYLGRPLRASAVHVFYLSAVVLITVVYFYNVFLIPLDRDYSEMYERLYEAQSILQIMYERSLGRVAVEDMDWVIIRSFQADPASMMLGRGFGLAHLFTDPFIPASHPYMVGTLNAPKSGITFFLVNGGVFSLLLITLFWAALTPVAEDVQRVADAGFAEYVYRAQLVIVPLFVMFMLRVYVLDTGLALLAVLSAPVVQARAWRLVPRPG